MAPATIDGDPVPLPSRDETAAIPEVQLLISHGEVSPVEFLPYSVKDAEDLPRKVYSNSSANASPAIRIVLRVDMQKSIGEAFHSIALNRPTASHGMWESC